VVESGSAPVGIEDSALVALEDVLVSLNGDGEGCEGKGGLHGFNVVGGDLGGTNILKGGVGVGVVSAVSVFAGVGVVGLEDGVVGLEVLEGGGLVSTVASEGKGDAIDELLLGEGHKFAVSDEVGSLEGSGGGEGPARSALSLILDGGDGTGINPVDGSGGVLNVVGELGLGEDLRGPCIRAFSCTQRGSSRRTCCGQE